MKLNNVIVQKMQTDISRLLLY